VVKRFGYERTKKKEGRGVKRIEEVSGMPEKKVKFQLTVYEDDSLF